MQPANCQVYPRDFASDLSFPPRRPPRPFAIAPTPHSGLSLPRFFHNVQLDARPAGTSIYWRITFMEAFTLVLFLAAVAVALALRHDTASDRNPVDPFFFSRDKDSIDDQ